MKVLSALLVAMLLLVGCNQKPPPLHQAIIDQNETLVEVQLKSGDDPMKIWQFTQPGHSGATFDLQPLQLAVVRPNQQIIRLLAQHGADIYASNQNDMTAFEWAIRFDHYDNVRLLWEMSDKHTYRQHAANALRLGYVGGNREMFDYLLEEIGSPEAVGGLFEYFAGFGGATKNSGLRWIDELLALGLQPDTRSMVQAAKKRNIDVMQRLLDVGVSVDGPAGIYSPLQSALAGWDTGIAAWLLEHGADPNRLDPYGRTPAMTVVRVRRPRQRADIAEMREDFQQRIIKRLELLQHFGADLSLTATDGRALVAFLDEEHDPDAAYSRAQLKAFLNQATKSAP